jgi:CRISPR-associated protein Cst1
MSVRTESIWFTTGNPFADTGQEMMAAMVDVDSPDELTTGDVKSLLPRLVDLYFQEGWNKASHSIFPNSSLNNPAIKHHERRKRYASVLNSWMEAIEDPESHRLDATCALSGRPANVYITKVYLPMSDFGTGNFQSNNQEGTPLSAAVALALQFFPLGLVKVGKMLALPHFSNDDVQYEWAKQSVDRVEESEALGAGGVRDLGTSKPANAFFKLVENLVRGQREFPNSSVTLYLFNNFNQVDFKNAAELHYMPSPVFRFISAAINHSDGRPWHQIVRRGYVTKKQVEDEDEALRRYDNLVYSRLLRGESISAFFRDRRQRRPVVRGESGWRLFSGYLKEVGGMDQRRIDSLRDLGDRIAPLVRERRRRLLTLEGAGSRGALTDVLYRISKDAMNQGHERPLITFGQLITDIFPHDVQYNDWREVKYLLLFRIYEQLFDELKGDPEYANTEAPQNDQEGEE